jgi:ABC-type branched-subunit amino acid transport system substrate-binding protein
MTMRFAYLTGVLALSSCSFIVDDSPYACAAGGGCPEQSMIGCTLHRLCGGDKKSLCVDDGESAVCRPLVNEAVGCSHTYPANPADLGDADIFPIGLIAQWPSPGDSSSYGVPTTQAVEVALSNINAERGLPVRGMPARKLLAVVCNEARPTPDDSLDGDRPFLKPRVDHLTSTLRVSAIIGGSTSGATRRINGIHMEGSDALLLSPTATDDLLPDTFRDDEGGAARQLFWRTVAPDGQQLPAILAVHALARSAILETKAEPDLLDVFSIYNDDNSASQNLQNLFSQERGFLASSLSFRSNDKAQKDSVVEEIVRKGPRFILPFGTGEFVSSRRGDVVESMLADVEDQWNDERFPRPWYLLTEGNRSASFQPALSVRMDVVDRVIGTAPGPRTSPLYTFFNNAYREYFRSERPNMLEGSSSTPGNLAESGYDAAFLLAYAATKATRDGSWPRGPELAQAIDALDCKDQGAQRVQAYRNAYRGHVDSLAQNPEGCFDFEGASGELDYIDSPQSTGSPKAKDPTADFALWCLGDLSAPDTTTNLRQYYSRESMAITATENAPALSFRDTGWCARAAD